MKIVAVAGRLNTGKDTVAEILAEQGWQRIAFADPLKRLVARIFGFGQDSLFGPSANRNRIVTYSDVQWCRICFDAALQLDAIVSMLYPRVVNEKRVGQVKQALLKTLSACHAEERAGHFSVRRALQLFGTDFARELNPNVWIEACWRAIDAVRDGAEYDPMRGYRVDRMLPPPVGVVITDCRFRNEAENIRARGGKVYWLDADKRVVQKKKSWYERFQAKLRGQPSLFLHASEPGREVFNGTLDGVIDNNGTLVDLVHEVQRVVIGG